MSNILNDIIFPKGGLHHSLITWVGGCAARPKFSKWVARTTFKNKDDERNIEFDQRGMTYYSDAVDTLLMELLKSPKEYLETVFNKESLFAVRIILCAAVVLCAAAFVFERKMARTTNFIDSCHTNWNRAVY